MDEKTYTGDQLKELGIWLVNQAEKMNKIMADATPTYKSSPELIDEFFIEKNIFQIGLCVQMGMARTDESLAEEIVMITYGLNKFVEFIYHGTGRYSPKGQELAELIKSFEDRDLPFAIQDNLDMFATEVSFNNIIKDVNLN